MNLMFLPPCLKVRIFRKVNNPEISRVESGNNIFVAKTSPLPGEHDNSSIQRKLFLSRNCPKVYGSTIHFNGLLWFPIAHIKIM